MNRIKKEPPVLILLNIRSTHNVGSIFRTADAAGVSHIYLVGYTPSPLDQFGRKRKDICKVSLGAEDTIKWSSHKTLSPLITKLKKEGRQLIGLEQHPSSKKYTQIASSKCALVLGNEVDGIDTKSIALCDTIMEIPMHGKKESLNVSVAAGIALFELIK